MNGRFYSPSLGRMLSPDPVTQSPENGQNYNRYTYAMNNPLKYTDPSGWQARCGQSYGGAEFCGSEYIPWNRTDHASADFWIGGFSSDAVNSHNAASQPIEEQGDQLSDGSPLEGEAEFAPRLGGEVSVDTGQLEEAADQGMLMGYLRTLLGNPNVNQASLHSAMLNVLAVNTGVTFTRTEARAAAAIQNARSHQQTVVQGLGAVMAAPAIGSACTAAPSICYSAAEGMLVGSGVRIVTDQSVNAGSLAVDATVGVAVGVPLSAAGAASGAVGEWIWRLNSQTLTIPMNLPPP
jgi:hypothetical protein